MNQSTTSSLKVAFIGMGVMGYPMAGHLARAGYEVTVYNRTQAKADQWVAEFGGTRADTPKAAADNKDAVFVCVGNDDDVRSVIYGDSGILAGLKKDAVLVDHTTASADLARELGEAAAGHGAAFLDAPVSGGQIGAENGQLTVMVGGAASVLSRVQPLMDTFSKFVGLQGPVGSGQLAKMVNQICIAGVVQGLSEGLAFAKRAGLDPEKLVDAISKGSAGSWQMENRSHTMWKDEFEFGFAVDWMRKDLGIALAEANRNGARLPVTALIDQFYADVQQAGGRRWDTSSLITRLK
ncbi:NAD(P)-dependent oxidoreductase [Aliidiomarina halalkaliphila]|uniref:NAD(P)-dependent oxidoreductase n=1 Tax=Aliidiomarina halalkaliphila TaxID=2593535 RepID=A0A552X4F5_9GAMM|nr:NAD(P)-dependent oxidoreductase [Aliidiomarina halalkaliphila]TRW49836.1 NAD(P)-dependent oxidoreductase [Aliidiomarina halalkaliphila]